MQFPNLSLDEILLQSFKSLGTYMTKFQGDLVSVVFHGTTWPFSPAGDRALLTKTTQKRFLSSGCQSIKLLWLIISLSVGSCVFGEIDVELDLYFFYNTISVVLIAILSVFLSRRNSCKRKLQFIKPCYHVSTELWTHIPCPPPCLGF